MDVVVQNSANAEGGVESKAEPFTGITVEELNVRWKAAVVDLSKKGINVTNPGSALEGALSIRYGFGTECDPDTLCAASKFCEYVIRCLSLDIIA